VRVGAYSNGLSGLKSVSRKGETMAPVEPFVNVLSEVVTRSIAGSFRTLTCDGQTNPGDLIDATAAFGMMFKASRGNDTLTRSRAYDHSPSDPDMGASAPASERDPDTECGSDSVRYFYDGEDRDTYRTDSYRARPLNGIWASAPYLHNGSVPTLADLLEVEEDRPEVFSISKKPTFDPVRVGLVPSDATQAFQYDTRIPGNSNSGHVHGTNLPPVDKAALLEYLKSL
jgi:hypothetical protein